MFEFKETLKKNAEREKAYWRKKAEHDFSYVVGFALGEATAMGVGVGLLWGVTVFLILDYMVEYVKTSSLDHTAFGVLAIVAGAGFVLILTTFAFRVAGWLVRRMPLPQVVLEALEEKEKCKEG